jgi:hypothetical protein
VIVPAIGAIGVLREEAKGRMLKTQSGNDFVLITSNEKQADLLLLRPE